MAAEGQRLLRVAPGRVWEFWRDLPRWPTWQPETREGRWLEGVPWADGSTFGLLRQGPWPLFAKLPGGDARRFVGRVLSTADQQLLVWELRPTTLGWLGPTLIQSIRLEPAPGGTTLTLTLSAYGPLPTLLGPLGLEARMEKQIQETLGGLQRHVQPTQGRI